MNIDNFKCPYCNKEYTGYDYKNRPVNKWVSINTKCPSCKEKFTAKVKCTTIRVETKRVTKIVYGDKE